MIFAEHDRDVGARGRLGAQPGHIFAVLAMCFDVGPERGDEVAPRGQSCEDPAQHTRNRHRRCPDLALDSDEMLLRTRDEVAVCDAQEPATRRRPSDRPVRQDDAR
ncbi:hypothetical protein [Lentzea sp.]|uniref:hypothetical protein n=1 Tax=Lentzea sp. TaxID=56099 RepID=UPI002D0154A8|nr:hypothetical protein [Lentzea sp.]HUQ58337.1 hypothetical protein [Lentzea sp.]